MENVFCLESRRGIRIWVLCVYVNWEETGKEEEVDHTDVVTQGRLYGELADIVQGSTLLGKLATPVACTVAPTFNLSAPCIPTLTVCSTGSRFTNFFLACFVAMLGRCLYVPSVI